MGYRFDPEGHETRALHELADFSGKDVIEIGCGDGRMTLRYADRAASVLALDPKADRIADGAKRLPKELREIVSFRAANITEIELSPASFDIAIFSWSL